jgi:transposase
MIPVGVKVFLASHPVDFRKGPDGLMALVRDAGADPFGGGLYLFRAKRADRIKIARWDGTGLCLYARRLEKVSFCWPRDRSQPRAVEPGSAAGAGRGDGLDEGAGGAGEPAAIGGVKACVRLTQMPKSCGNPGRSNTKRASRPRKSFAPHLERVEVVIEPEDLPGHEGREKILIGEDVSERLDVTPAKFRVIVTRRPKYAYRGDDGVIQAPAPDRIIEGGIPPKLC